MNDEKPLIHPGGVLLEEFMKPRGVTQYRLAQEIGVPQIRVSEIVRGMRAISADTALRFGRFFGTDETLWLDLQRKYDMEVERRRLGGNLEGVHPRMRARGLLRAGGPTALRTLVNAADIVEWSNRTEAQVLLPKVVRSLVLSTGAVEQGGRVTFASGEGVQLEGWDGLVEAPEGHAFVPEGISAWELGTGKGVKRKADADYRKRSEKPLGLDPSHSAFIFVTPRRWAKKEEWSAAKQAEGAWREVRVYDADDLETWLEFAPGVHVWLSTLVGKHPEDAGPLRTFWEGWAGATGPPMSAELVISGREKEAKQLLEWLRGRPSPLALRAESKEEALAFFAASLYLASPTERETYFARGIVVEGGTAWKQLSFSQEGLVLVPRFGLQDADVTPAGHHLLIPLGSGEGWRSTALVELERPQREKAKEALLAMGIPAEKAEDLATLARRSPMALRRKLAVAPQIKRPGWAEPAEARTLLPTVLIGTWKSTNAGDREVVAKLARKPYEEVEPGLVRWVNEPDPPARRVGDTWLIASKEDAWSLLVEFLSSDDLDAFEQVVLDVLGELDPSFDMPADQRWTAGMYGKSPTHSGLLREGLAETLALMGARSETTPLSTADSGQDRANTIVRKLVDKANADWRLWASLSSILPLLAEAAPDVFLEAVGKGVSGNQPLLLNLFSDPGPFGSSPHTGLLWALETLAWNPDHLGYASLLLARLAALDPDPNSRYLSRPMRSLWEIFQLWYPQTKAGPKTRMRVIDAVRHREPSVAWNLMCSILPEITGGFSVPTSSPRWRDWALEEPPKVTYGEIWAGTGEVIERLLDDVGVDEQRWHDLIDKVDDLPKEQHDAVVARLMEADVASFSPEGRIVVRDALREMISKHREFPDTDWAMPGEWVDGLQRAYERFEPDDPVVKHAWLFSYHPDLLRPSGEGWRVEREDVEDARLSAAREVHARGGLNLMLSLAANAEHPGELGTTLGRNEILSAEEEISLLSEQLGSSEEPLRYLVRGFVSGRFRERDWAWVRTRLSDAHGWSSEQLADFFTSLPFEARTWDQLEATEDEEAQRLYWSQISPYGLIDGADSTRAVDNFMAYGQPHAAVDIIAFWADREGANIRTSLMVEALEGTVSIAPAENFNWSHFSHHVSEVLDTLEASDEINEERIATLEWQFLPLFGYHGRPPRVLHRELSRNPDFFAEIISFVFKAEDEESRAVSEEEQTRARLAYELLETWRSVPGQKRDGSVDADSLRAWVDAAREATQTARRGTVADLKIGEALVSSPQGAGGVWPDVAIRNLIDDLSNEEIERGFEIGITNRRGVVSRSLTEGGQQERELMEKYKGYADALTDGWPRTAAMLLRISDSYASDARREDIRAELREDLWR